MDKLAEIKELRKRIHLLENALAALRIPIRYNVIGGARGEDWCRVEIPHPDGNFVSVIMDRRVKVVEMNKELAEVLEEFGGRK